MTTPACEWIDIHSKMRRMSILFHHGLSQLVAQREESRAKQGTPVKAGITTYPADRFELEAAIPGQVITRFPPEASGYLHIGHAKAALINAMFRNKYNGKMILRFDDTNPCKETRVFEDSIIEDLRWLGVQWDIGPTYTSDYFPRMLQMAKTLIQQDKAYVDFTPKQEMSQLREELKPTSCRGHTRERNLELWREMQLGTLMGTTCCLRAKIDFRAPNGSLRDPSIYRTILNPPHPRTGSHYKCYPTYDFACPIMDSLEGVSHALRTTEYHDREAQYDWFIGVLGLRKPHLNDYSRLNMEYSVMSKRKITMLIHEKLVEGWNDPRLPTVRGLIRRGLCADAMVEFVKVQGASKVVNLMEWSKLWAFNQKILDPSVRRFTAVSAQRKVRCKVYGTDFLGLQPLKRLWHKKNEALGSRLTYFGDEIWLEMADVVLLNEGEEVTLMHWGNAYITCIQKKASMDMNQDWLCEATLHLKGNVHQTKHKLSWLACQAELIPIECVEFDHLFRDRKTGTRRDQFSARSQPTNPFPTRTFRRT